MSARPARRWRKAAIWLSIAILALYGAVVLVMGVFQRDLLYPDIDPRPAKPGYETISLQTADGLTLQAGYRAPRPGMPTLVFFHGNAMVWPQSTCCTSAAATAGYGLLLAEYRGYNGNPGEPTEQGLYADGRAALAWLAAQGTLPEDTVLVGYSLGSGVATQLASEISPRALILLSGYARIVDVAGGKYPLLPVGSLLLDRFDNVDKIGQIDVPVLLVHGAADELVPLEQARAMEAAQPAAQLIILPGGGHHEAAESDVMQERQVEFLHALKVRDAG